MKKPSSKKGFSLIELIVVIAVIAAIAAVIVPSITNMSQSAKVASDTRNVQLWNQTYLEASSAGATGLPTVAVDATTLGAINATVSVGGQNVTFSSPAVTLVAGKITTAPTATTPAVYTAN